MGTSLESELRSLLVYYGERPESSEAHKPEDFFSLILSFSSALQVYIHSHCYLSMLIVCLFRDRPWRFMMLRTNHRPPKSCLSKKRPHLKLLVFPFILSGYTPNTIISRLSRAARKSRHNP